MVNTVLVRIGEDLPTAFMNAFLRHLEQRVSQGLCFPTERQKWPEINRDGGVAGLKPNAGYRGEILLLL